MSRLAATIAASFLLALAGAGQAAANAIASGKTSITLSDGIFRALKRDEVKILQLRPGKVRGRVISFHASGGAIDPLTGVGRINHRGGFKLELGQRAVALRNFSIDTAKRSLSAEVGGDRLTLASTRGLTHYRNGLSNDVVVDGLRVTDAAAIVLNRKLGLPGLFRAGGSLGKLGAGTRPTSVRVLGGTISLALDAGFLAKLGALEVSVAPFESTTLTSPAPPTYTLRVLRGSLAPDFASGALLTAGGLRLTQGGPPATAAQMLVAPISLALDSKRASSGFDVRPSPPLAGPLGTAPLAAIAIYGAAIGEEGDGTVSMSDTDAKLEPYAADLLNEAFAKPRGKAPFFSPGEPLGAFTFKVETG